MSDVMIMDNFLSIPEQKKILDIVYDPNLDWNYRQYSCRPDNLNKAYVIDKNTIDSPMFAKQFYVRSGIIYIDILNLIYRLETLKQKSYMDRILRIKTNKHHKDILFPDNFYSYPHRDFNEKTESLLYYVNDSDGDTFIFNERMKDVSLSDTKLTINKRVSPKQGRAVLFDGSMLHAGSPPRIHDTRIIISAVFRKE